MKLPGPVAAAAALPLWLLLASASVRAQAPAAAAAQPSTAPLEVRIAAAQAVQVQTAILDVQLGDRLEEAHQKLDRLCARGTRPKEEGGDNDADKDHPKSEREDDPKKEGEQRPAQTKSAGVEDQDEGHKVIWELGGTDYSSVFIIAGADERITSITAFLRPEKRLPFAEIGDVSKAPLRDENSVVWDVLRPGRPLFRVIAKGAKGEASSLMLFVVPRRSSRNRHFDPPPPGDSH